MLKCILTCINSVAKEEADAKDEEASKCTRWLFI